MGHSSIRDALIHRTRDTSILMAFDPEQGVWMAEVYLRRERAVYYLGTEYSEGRPTLEQLRADAYMSGKRSPRPYRLQQRWDVSVRACVLALLIHLCTSNQRDPRTFWNRAMPHDPRPSAFFSHIQQQAEWEQVEYPAQWSRKAIQWLCEQLHRMQYDDIVRAIIRELT